MAISTEGKIGILLGLIGLAGAGAIMIAPTELWIGWTLIAIAGLGLAALAVYHFGTRVLRPKAPHLHCFFDVKDIGGCVCPNTRLKSRDTILSIPQQNASTAFTGVTTTIVPTTVVVEPQGTTLTPSGLGAFKAGVEENGPFHRGTYYRVKVTAKNGTVGDCRGKLISLKRQSKSMVGDIILPFAPSENADALNKTIHENDNEHLDFLFIHDTGHVELTPYKFLGPSGVDWQNLFSEPGDYAFDIRVFSPAAQAAITIFFHWTGDPKTSGLAQMG
jgi:hypothetical protein